MSFSIYDILKEADGDEESTPDAGNDTQEASAGEDTPAEDNANDNNDGGDDDFDIDTSLDDIDTGGEEDNGDNNDENTSSNDDTNMSGEDDEDEPIEANTDIFSSLSAEEQQMKIRELKRQYADLYNSCNDFIEKLGSIETNDITLAPISRMTNIIMDLRNYISDYLYYQFASKSYYENDVMLNRFFAVFKSTSTILSSIINYNREN